MIISRFAPSPTGFLHLGHAYSALLAFQLAKTSNGLFKLRIEDIDLIRCKKIFHNKKNQTLLFISGLLVSINHLLGKRPLRELKKNSS